ncbi:Sugar nucleotidyltransferase-like protein [Nitrosopumilaceae archaeon]|nr:Sugar nucleotidyltransferase-like protein [Nitrosopumilaceae archaeon]
MRAVIAAAGSATRLGEQTRRMPKGMLDINGIPMLQRQADLLRRGGVEDIVVVVGPHKEEFSIDGARYIEDKGHADHDVLLSLMAAKKEITGDVIISYSDILYGMDVLDAAIRSDADIGMVTDTDWRGGYEGRTEHPVSEADIVLMDGGRVVRAGKRIPTGGSHRDGEFIGMVRLSPAGAAAFVREFERAEGSARGPFHGAAEFKRAYLTDMIQEIIDRGIAVAPIEVSGGWVEVDTPQDLENARRRFT